MSELDNSAATDTVAPNAGAPEASPAAPKSDSAPDAAPDAASATAEPEAPKRDSGVQREITRLSRHRREAERRAERLATELDDLRKQVSQLSQARSAQVESKDFPNYDAYVDARAELKAKEAARQEIEASNRTRTEQETLQHLQGVASTFMEKVEEQAESAGVDAEAVMETLRAQPNLSVTVMERLAESDQAARLAEFLAENPSELDRVSRLGPTLANRALDKMEAKFGSPSKPARTSTNAPAPPKTVGGRAVMQADPHKQTIDEYAVGWEERQKQQAKFG